MKIGYIILLPIFALQVTGCDFIFNRTMQQPSHANMIKKQGIQQKAYTCNDIEMYGRYSGVCRGNPLNYTQQKVEQCAKSLCYSNR